MHIIFTEAVPSFSTPFHFAPFGLTALTALRSVLLKNRRLVKLILKYHCHLKAETTNTKVIKEVLAGNLFDLSAVLTVQAASVKDCKVCPLKGGGKSL